MRRLARKYPRTVAVLVYLLIATVPLAADVFQYPSAGGGGSGTVTIGGGGAFTPPRVPFASGASALVDDADLTFATDTLSATKVAMSSLTSGRVPVASTAGLLIDDLDLTFATDTLTATIITAPTRVCGAGALDAANSVCVGSNTILSEGSGVDTSELALVFGNHTADATMTWLADAAGIGATGAAVYFGGAARTSSVELGASTAGTTEIESYSSSSTGHAKVQLVNNAFLGWALTMFGSAHVGTTFLGTAAAGIAALQSDTATGLEAGTSSATPVTVGTNSVKRIKVSSAGAVQTQGTITATGTTGAQTINKMSGTVNFAMSASTLVVTNSLVSTSSTIFAEKRTNDTTCNIRSVVPAAGSFTINMTAACAAETSVGWLVVDTNL